MTILLGALVLGFIGSFHCVAMCGPIALALPLNRSSLGTQVGGILAYNGGRVVTYSLLGSLFGIIGASFILAGYQQILSIALGAVILISVVLPEHLTSRFRITSGLFSFLGAKKYQVGKLFGRKGLPALFLIGLLNGLLPCGFVYAGIAGAVLVGGSMQGALFMTLFGLGTIPAMAIISLTGNKISVGFRNKLQRVLPFLVIIMALFLILRGMNLGIPYLSPRFSTIQEKQHMLCHP